MWGDILPHITSALSFHQSLRFASCLRQNISVSTGCKACQIIIDASLGSISYSTNKATLADRNKPWGLTVNVEKCMQDDRRGKQEDSDLWKGWGVSVCLCVCVTWVRFVVYMSLVEVLSFWCDRENTWQVLDDNPSSCLFSKKKRLTGWIYYYKHVKAKASLTNVFILTIKQMNGMLWTCLIHSCWSWITSAHAPNIKPCN